MRLECLVEEESAAVALQYLIPKILGRPVTTKLIRFQGKPDLLKKLPSRLQAYREILKREKDLRVVVLIDEDREDCRKLKRDLEKHAKQSGLTTKTAAGPRQQCHVLNRIAVEELEAWFFGDLDALAKAYPKVHKALSQGLKKMNPDAISGGTWETLERILQRAGYHRGGLAKKKAAQDISVHMDPEKNRSKSFCVFRDGLREMLR